MALGVEEEILDGNEGTGRNYRNMETEEMATRPHGCLPHSIGAEFTKQLWLHGKQKQREALSMMDKAHVTVTLFNQHIEHFYMGFFSLPKKFHFENKESHSIRFWSTRKHKAEKP